MKRRGEERRTKEENNGDCETKLGRDLLREGKEDKERETQVKQTNNPSLLDLCYGTRKWTLRSALSSKTTVRRETDILALSSCLPYKISYPYQKFPTVAKT